MFLLKVVSDNSPSNNHVLQIYHFLPNPGRQSCKSNDRTKCRPSTTKLTIDVRCFWDLRNAVKTVENVKVYTKYRIKYLQFNSIFAF